MKRQLLGIGFILGLYTQVLAMSGVDWESRYNRIESDQTARQMQARLKEKENTIGAYNAAFYEQRRHTPPHMRQQEEYAARKKRIKAYEQPWQVEYSTRGERAIEHAERKKKRKEEFMQAYQAGQLREAPEFVRPAQEVERSSKQKLEAMRQEGAEARKNKELAYSQGMIERNPDYIEGMAEQVNTAEQREKARAARLAEYNRAYAEVSPQERAAAARKEESAARLEREIEYYGGSRSRLQATRDYINDTLRQLSRSGAELAESTKAKAQAALIRADEMFKLAWKEAGKKTEAAKRKMNEFIAAGLEALRAAKAYLPQAQAQEIDNANLSTSGLPVYSAAQEVTTYKALINKFKERNKYSKDDVEKMRDEFAKLRYRLRSNLSDPALNEKVTKQIVPFLVRTFSGKTAADYVEYYVKKLDVELGRRDFV